MKYVKYTLGILAVLAIGFFLLGQIKSEIYYECEVMVDKPISESWAVSLDKEKLADWLNGYQKTEPISGTPGTVGAVTDVYFITDGQEMTIRETITNIVPNESISMLFTSDFVNMDYTLTMKSVDGKTQISTTTTCKGNSMFSKSLIVLMSSYFKTEENTNLTNLKKVIEENSKDYFLQ